MLEKAVLSEDVQRLQIRSNLSLLAEVCIYLTASRTQYSDTSLVLRHTFPKVNRHSHPVGSIKLRAEKTHCVHQHPVCEFIPMFLHSYVISN